MLQNFQIALLFHQQGVKRKKLVWQRRILLAGIAVLCSVLIDLFIPMQASTQQRASLTLTPTFHQSSFAVPRRFQGEIIRKVNLSSGSKAIALTFDDGPSSNTTPQVLDILKEKNIKATFFLIGKNLKNFPQIGQQLVANGHALGNHTWHHWHRQVSQWTITSEIEDTAALIYETTGVKTSLFRPPNGFLYNGLADYARKRKDVVVLWSINSGDWRRHGVSVEQLINKVVESAKPGAIVLMHDGGGERSRTVQALPKIIDELTARGYEFVTVPELLERF